MRLATDHASELHRAGLDRVEGIDTSNCFNSPVRSGRDIEESIVERKADIGDERRRGAETSQDGRQIVGRRFGGNLDHFIYAPGSTSATAFPVPHPDRRRQVFQAGDNADEAVSLVERGPQLEHHLMLGAEFERSAGDGDC